MSSSRNLTKVQTQGPPYNWVWETQYGNSVAHKALGTSRMYLWGTDDTELLIKVNSHDGYRILDMGKPEHG